MAGEARVVLDTVWDQEAHVVTTTRTWSRPDDVITDRFARRVRSLDELQAALNRAGLEVVETYDDPRRRDEPARGPVAYVVARVNATLLLATVRSNRAICRLPDARAQIVGPGEERRAP